MDFAPLFYDRSFNPKLHTPRTDKTHNQNRKRHFPPPRAPNHQSLRYPGIRISEKCFVVELPWRPTTLCRFTWPPYLRQTACDGQQTSYRARGKGDGQRVACEGGTRPVLTSPIDQEVREVGKWSLVKCCRWPGGNEGVVTDSDGSPWFMSSHELY